MAFDKAAFVEELIQLQIKHEVQFSGYDLSIETKLHSEEIAKQRNDPRFLITEESIRAEWAGIRIDVSDQKEQCKQ